MSETIKQQPEGDLHDKYTLKGEGFVWPLIRSVLIFIGTLLVAIVGAEVEAGGGLDPFAIVYCMLLTPFAFINAFFQWLLYHFNIRLFKMQFLHIYINRLFPCCFYRLTVIHIYLCIS